MIIGLSNVIDAMESGRTLTLGVISFRIHGGTLYQRIGDEAEEWVPSRMTFNALGHTEFDEIKS